MPDCELKSAVQELLPELAVHLERALSPHVMARYPVADIVQDSYVRAVDRLETLRHTNRTSMLAWLRRIAHRLVIDKIRQKQTHQLNGREASAICAALAASGATTPSHEVAATEVAKALETALADCSDDQRIVLELRYVKQLSFVEISKRLGRPSGAIRGLHRTALKSLRRSMGGSSLYFSR